MIEYVADVFIFDFRQVEALVKQNWINLVSSLLQSFVNQEGMPGIFVFWMSIHV
jgi:hypothetical protein